MNELGITVIGSAIVLACPDIRGGDDGLACQTAFQALDKRGACGAGVPDRR